MTEQAQQAPTTTAAAEIEGMRLVPEGGEPWATRLAKEPPPHVARATGALGVATGSRAAALKAAWTLDDAGLLAETADRCCTRCGDGNLYPRRCSQCGQRWADRACGPTHALIAKELGVDELRVDFARAVEWADRLAAEIAPSSLLNKHPDNTARWAAAIDIAHRQQGTPEERAPVKPEYMRTYLAETLGLTPEQVEVTSDRDLLLTVAHWVQLGKQATLKRRDEPPGVALTREELAAEFAKREAADHEGDAQ